MRTSLALPVVLLALLLPIVPLAAQEGKPEPVAVQLSNFKFAPAALTLQQGHSYVLHLVNTAGGSHDFTAPEFFAASTVAEADRSRIVDGKIRLAGRQTVDVTLTPNVRGTYRLRCSHFLHSGMGMNGTITVR